MEEGPKTIKDTSCANDSPGFLLLSISNKPDNMQSMDVQSSGGGCFLSNSSWFSNSEDGFSLRRGVCYWYIRVPLRGTRTAELSVDLSNALLGTHSVPRTSRSGGQPAHTSGRKRPPECYGLPLNSAVICISLG